jgi:transcriptional/translational regulatory protein YebC/TACO1
MIDAAEMRKYIEESTKEIMKKQGDIVPQVFLCLPEGGVALVVMPMSDEPDMKNRTVDALRELVEKHKVEMYYTAMTGWMVNPERVKECLKEKMELMKQRKVTIDEFIEFAKVLKNSPAGNPTREETLILAEISKKEGARVKIQKVIRENPESTDMRFEMLTNWDDEGDGYNRFNVWTPNQVTLGER